MCMWMGSICPGTGAGEFENAAIGAAIAVNEDGCRKVLGAAEYMKEDRTSRVSFFQWRRSRGLDGVKRIVGDQCPGMLEAVGEVFPEAKCRRCTVHFCRNVFSVTPRSKVKPVAKMLKAIHAQRAVKEKAKAVVEDGIEEMLTCCDFPSKHWPRIRTDNVIERLNRESAAALVWWADSRTAILPSCWSVPGCVIRPAPNGETRNTGI